MPANEPVLPPIGSAFKTRPYHRHWLTRQADDLFSFFEPNLIHPHGGFFDLDSKGEPVDRARALRQIHATTRAVHCFAIGVLLGRPGKRRDRRSRHGVSLERAPRRDAWRLCLVPRR